MKRTGPAIPAWLLYLLCIQPTWIVASGKISPIQIAWGLVVGGLTLPLAWRIFDLGRSYPLYPLLQSVGGALYSFFILFVPDAVRSSIDMARRVMQPVIPMYPGIVSIPIRFRGSADALLLVNHVTLTPGSLVVEIDEEPGLLFLHTIDARDPDRIREQVQRLHREQLRRMYR